MAGPLLDSGRERVDVFKGVRPYYGPTVLDELRDNVPTLMNLCTRCILERSLNFDGLPTVIHSKLTEYKLRTDYKGPKIFKCSVCSKFYSKHKKFIEHTCTM